MRIRQRRDCFEFEGFEGFEEFEEFEGFEGFEGFEEFEEFQAVEVFQSAKFHGSELQNPKSTIRNQQSDIRIPQIVNRTL